MPRKKQRPKTYEKPLSLFPMNFGQAVDHLLGVGSKPKRKKPAKPKAKRKAKKGR